MGRILAEEAPAPTADLVIGVPDTGPVAAAGFAEESGIPDGEGLVKNRYVGRTFIQPTQSIRQQGIRLKLNPLRAAVKGRKLVVVDDSIVRGNTTRAIVKLLREAGALEVHLRITSPPIRWPCYYGIDMATKAELVASDLVIEEICQFVGAFSATFPNLKDAVLVSGTDGVGTKLLIAQTLGRHDTIGSDAVAMVVDDIVCNGAEPLFLLDYIACGKLVPERIAEIVSGL